MPMCAENLKIKFLFEYQQEIKDISNSSLCFTMEFEVFYEGSFMYWPLGSLRLIILTSAHCLVSLPQLCHSM